MTSFLPAVVGCFSVGAAENPTVTMMEASFAHESLDWRYVNCEVTSGDLAAAVAGARAMGWRGFNCSMPHKQSVIALLDELSLTARICQAVNCVAPTETGWIGHNTDGVGFVDAVRGVVELDGAEVLVIGAGGAAHAIAIECARAGARDVGIAARRSDAAARLARLVTVETGAAGQVVDWSRPLLVPTSAQLVVNATPVGMSPHDGELVEVAWERIGPDTVVGDVVPKPADTRFLQAARSVGATTVDGREMLVNQGAENIHIWTGLRPDLAVMRSALDEALGLG